MNWINKKGGLILKGDLLEEFEGYRRACDTCGLFIAHSSTSEQKALVNAEGNIIINEEASGIEILSDSLFLVSKDDDKYHTGYEGVFNFMGEVVIPFGKHDIKSFSEGIFEVIGAEEELSDFISENGKKVLSLSEVKKRYNFTHLKHYGGFQSGWLKVTFKYPNYEPNCGFIDKKGEVTLTNVDWETCTQFSSRRAFVKTKKGWKLIDATGKQIGNMIFNQVAFKRHKAFEDFFDGGTAFVEHKGKWMLIDTLGKVMSERLDLSGYKNVRAWLSGEYSLLFSLYDGSTEKKAYWNARSGYFFLGNVRILEPVASDVLMIKRDSAESHEYINTKKELFPLEIETKHLNTLNTTLTSHPRYPVRPKLEDSSSVAYNQGYWNYENHRVKIKKELEKIDSLSLILKTEDETEITSQSGRRFRAFKMYVVNGGEDTVFARTIDDNLHIRLQGKDKHGVWKDIELFRGMGCESFNRFPLPKGWMWEFKVPFYTGAFKTKLRAYIHYTDKEGSYTLYSNEVSMKINPAQFWRGRYYAPADYGID